MLEELKKKARKNVLDLLKFRVKYKRMFEETGRTDYRHTYQSYDNMYLGAKMLYEDTFEEVFEITDNERVKIYGEEKEEGIIYAHIY